MNQYLDKKDGKWHVSLSMDIPRILIKNKLNFRLHSVVMKNGKVVRDPSLSSSKYIFEIAPSFMGKKGFFFSYFEPTEIEEVDKFNFGLCDERVRWYDDTIISVKSEMITLVNELEVHKIESSPTEKQEFAPAYDIEFTSEIIPSAIINYELHIDSEDLIKLVGKAEAISEEPLLISSLEAPKKASAKKGGRRKR